MRMLAIALFVAFAPAPAEREAFEHGVEFSVLDARDRIDYPLGPDLVVRARREVDSRGTHMGWVLKAIDRRLEESPNFLYDCLCGHGAYPTDLLAWHLVSPEAVANVGPLTERILPVWGYPYELRVRCADCEAQAGDPLSPRFLKGTIQISWRRLAESNPRQKRLSDFRR